MKRFRMMHTTKVLNRAKLVLAAVLFGVGLVAPIPAGAVVKYSMHFKPYTTNNTYAWCIDYWGNGIPGARIDITMKWVANSNVHLHPYTPGHPVSTISPAGGTTGSNGSMPVTIYTTLIGQDEYAEGTCTKSGYQSTTRQSYFTVGYDDIWYNNHPEIWVNVGATENHGGTDYNRYMMTDAAYGIYYTTYDYFAFYGIPTNPVPQDQKVAANDEALPYGGIFDLNSNWWYPHDYHHRGTAVDIRGNTAANTVRVSRQAYFIDRCRAQGAELYQIEFAHPEDRDDYVVDMRRHIHCHWPMVP